MQNEQQHNVKRVARPCENSNNTNVIKAPTQEEQ
jgi:hypothetical protein